MIARLRPWWQKNIRFLIIAAVVIIVFILAVILFGWDWTGFTGGYSKITKTPQGTTTEYSPGKTLWDWMQLLAALAIPVVVVVATALFTTRQHKTDLTIADLQQQDTFLQTYFDRMSELFLKKDLRKSDPDDPTYIIAQARTVAALRRLDDDTRRRTLIQFLSSSQLIKIGTPGTSLLKGVDLAGANLEHTHLERADLGKAALQEATLDKAHMAGADLSGANLNGTKLRGADLSGAKLQGANLSGADLSGANLKGANYNTKRMQWKDAQGNSLTLEPTQWPQGFDPVSMGLICVDC